MGSRGGGWISVFDGSLCSLQASQHDPSGAAAGVALGLDLMRGWPPKRDPCEQTLEAIHSSAKRRDDPIVTDDYQNARYYDFRGGDDMR